jgi:hypothetical protein
MKEETVQTYPHIDAAVEAGTSAVVERMEGTRRALERTLRAGSGRERDRARAALLAYERALDLYRRLIELRDAAARAEASNMRGGTAITH